MRCTICSHPDRARIEFLSCRGVSNTKVAKKFDGISHFAVRRHRANHMPETLKASLSVGLKEASPVDLDRLRQEESENLLQRIVGHIHRCEMLLPDIEEAGDVNAAASSISGSYR